MRECHYVNDRVQVARELESVPAGDNNNQTLDKVDRNGTRKLDGDELC